MSKYQITSRRVDDETGMKYITVNDKDDFVIGYHPGRRSIDAARMVRKLMMPTLAEGLKMRNKAVARMTAEDRQKLEEWQEKYKNLSDSASDEGKLLETQMNALIERHMSDNSDSNADAIKAMGESLNVEQEAILDGILFAHTKYKGKLLSDPQQFDSVFSGPRSAMVELLRAEIIEHNGFLDQITG